MNLTWHIVKKDFLRLRLALALWVALMVGQFILSYEILHVVDADATILRLTVKSLDYMQNVLFGLQLLLCCLLVAALIVEIAFGKVMLPQLVMPVALIWFTKVDAPHVCVDPLLMFSVIVVVAFDPLVLVA